MGFLKIVLQFFLVMVVLISAVAVYFSSQKQKFSTVELNSYLVGDVGGTDEPVPFSLKIKPVTEQEIIEAIKTTTGPVTVSGVHYSLGGQIRYQNDLFLDMSDFNQVLNFDTDKKLITVQTGISWNEIQKIIDPHNLSIKIMQDYNDYTVGGSLSVNAHGRFLKAGSIINSVNSIRIVLPDGNIYDASPEKNTDLFYGAIGGYGGVGVIVQATLQLVDNIALERKVKSLSFYEFNNYFKGTVLNDDNIVLHQAVLYPPNFESLLDISWSKTDKPLTDDGRLRENPPQPWWESVMYQSISKSDLLHRFKKNLIDPYLFKGEKVVRRNFETSYSLRDSGFISSKKSTMALQEYLIPVNRFEIFVFNLRDIFYRHKADIYKILINYVPQDKTDIYSRFKGGMYSFKIIYLQGKNKKSSRQVGRWTEEIVRASLESHGAFILPFHINDSSEQIYQPFPVSNYLFNLKKKADPADRFRNLFWDQYRYAIYDNSVTSSGLPVSTAHN